MKAQKILYEKGSNFSSLFIVALTIMSFKSIKSTKSEGEYRVATVISESEGTKYKVVADDLDAALNEEKGTIEETPIRLLNGNGTLAEGTTVIICPGRGVSCEVTLVNDKGIATTKDEQKTKGKADILIVNPH